MEAPNPQPQAIKGKFRYVKQGHLPKASPHNFHLPAISEFQDERLLPLRSMRPVPTIDQLPSVTGHPQLYTHGFTAVSHPTTLHSSPYQLAAWKSPELLQRHYIPDTAELMRRVTGCKTVLTEALLLRSAIWSESDALATHASHAEKCETGTEEDEPGQLSKLETGFPQFIGFDPLQGGASPAPKIHVDYTPKGARTHLRRYHPELAAAAADIVKAEDAIIALGKDPSDEYKDSNGPRWALFSVWRPLKTVKRDPLALGDQRTFRDDDYVPVNVKTPCLGRPGVDETHDAECFLAHYSEDQEWYWIEDQRPEEVLIIGLFDSGVEGKNGKASGSTLHSSVDLPGTEHEEARESLELRCLCIW
ncbi:hypothetical protein F4780DRAFT_249976 [Xylariomycetidae sp. FL0641]|nr:hypothetical protein F4780DRAFT_249976 [Xylariomycetidae sp. FL0641]